MSQIWCSQIYALCNENWLQLSSTKKEYSNLLPLPLRWISQVAKIVKNLPAIQQIWVWCLGWEDPLEKRMATHSSSCLENSMVDYSPQGHRVGHDWVANTSDPSVQFISCESLSHVQFYVTWWTAACQASPSITNSWSLLKLMSMELVIPSNHLILCCPLLLPPLICLNIRVFSNDSVLHIRWPKYWSFSFSIRPSNEYSGLISFRMDWLEPLAVQGTLKSLLQHHSSKASILWGSAFFIV